MGFVTMEQWSPYAVGVGIGVLSWLSFLLSDKALGTSTSYARSCGMIGCRLVGPRVKDQPYYKKVVPIIDWQWMLVFGVLLGAFVSANLSGQFHLDWVPPLWEAEVGSSPLPRVGMALVGGLFLGFGSRWANGCTSGHGISGTLQLSINSWIAAICFFVGGILTAKLMFALFA